MRRTSSSILGCLVFGCSVAVLAAGGCTDDRVLTEDGDGETSVSTTLSTSTGSSTSGSSSTSIGTTTAAADDTDDAATTEATTSTSAGSVFLGPADQGGSSFQCDMFTQDCPPGEKCMPWANDGGGAWNATRCSPIAENPAADGEPCHAEGSATSGVDDCERGTMCWDVDPKTLEGVCVDFCVGTYDHPYCEDPSEVCPITGDGAILVCVPTCNPLQTDCLEGEACYPVGQYWLCAPDASGDLGAYGDPCEFINVCDSGLVCLDASTVPPGQPCEGAAGCCTEFCDLGDRLGDMQCAGAAEGQTCQAWYDAGTAPPGYEEVGVCALPQ